MPRRGALCLGVPLGGMDMLRRIRAIRPCRRAASRSVVELKPCRLGFSNDGRDTLAIVEVRIDQSLGLFKGGVTAERAEHSRLGVEFEIICEAGREVSDYALPEITVGLVAGRADRTVCWQITAGEREAC
jgi:hypothetical protein